MESAFQNADFCFHAIPVQKSAEFLKEAKPYIPHDLPIVLLSKGLEVAVLQPQLSIFAVDEAIWLTSQYGRAISPG
eukprot:scaffold338_cov377-Prasinococcus_capsulatus_cf.AAC.5